MNKRLEMFLLLLLAAGGAFMWCRLALPRYQYIDLSVGQTRAVEIAQKYMKAERGVDTGGYKMAVQFTVDEGADRYLQKTLGIAGSQRLIHQLHYDLFGWVIRYFREKQKEEYHVAVSSATGEVIGFTEK